MALVQSFDGTDDIAEREIVLRSLERVALDGTAEERADSSGQATPAHLAIVDLISVEWALVVVDGGDRIRALAIDFKERAQLGRGFTFVGSDASGSFSVHLEYNAQENAARLRFTYDPTESATPQDLLPVVEFLEALDPARTLRLWSSLSKTWTTGPMTIPSDHPRLPEGYAATVAALARVQRLARRSFPMPASVSHDDAAGIRRADRLLTGSVVTGRWTHADLVVDPELLAFLRTSEHGALLAFSSDYTETIDGHTLALGPAEHRLLTAFMANTELVVEPGRGTVVHLTPGDNDRYELRLLSRATPWEFSEERQRRRAVLAAAGLLVETEPTSAVAPDPERLREAMREAGAGRPLADFVVEGRT